jgi:BirA family transcriptional regulator, biotin operon repressor / biotin---[acetyl-CoA-carboxylase] ligase
MSTTHASPVSGTSWRSAADPDRRIGWSVEVHPVIGSTNDRARALLAAPRGEGVAVVAEEQTAGRGRHGRPWQSPAGRNLMVSVAVRPRLAASDAWMLSAAAALALLEACREALAGSVAARTSPWSNLGLKWPNDLVDGEGRKIAGILLETRIAGDRVADAVIGTGVNVNWSRSEMPAEIAGTAIGLCDLAGVTVDRVTLLRRYLASLDALVTQVEEGVSPLPAYRAASWLDGRDVTVELGERRVSGRVTGIDARGALRLERDGETLRLDHGSVIRVGRPARVAP